MNITKTKWKCGRGAKKRVPWYEGGFEQLAPTIRPHQITAFWISGLAPSHHTMQKPSCGLWLTSRQWYLVQLNQQPDHQTMMTHLPYHANNKKRAA
jgi:hypothetical protein